MTPCPDCARLVEELEAVRAELDRARSYRTLGGVPRPSTLNWANLERTPPPESASAPDAPPKRRPGYASSAPEH